MEEQFYEDLIRILNPKETLDPKEKAKNNEIIELRNKLKALFETLKVENNELKKALINIKRQIEEINSKYFLKLDNIIKDGKINPVELDFALRIIYPTERTKNQIEAANNLRKINSEINEVKRDIDEVEILYRKLEKLINELEEQLKHNINPIHFIKRKKRKDKITQIKNEIKSLIEKANNENNKYFQELKQKIDNNEFDKAKIYLKGIIDLIIEKANSKIKKKEYEKNKIKKKSGLTDEQIKNIISIESYNCIHILAHKLARFDLTKSMIIILELINQIEQKEYNETKIEEAKEAISEIDRKRK